MLVFVSIKDHCNPIKHSIKCLRISVHSNHDGRLHVT